MSWSVVSTQASKTNWQSNTVQIVELFLLNCSLKAVEELNRTISGAAASQSYALIARNENWQQPLGELLRCSGRWGVGIGQGWEEVIQGQARVGRRGGSDMGIGAGECEKRLGGNCKLLKYLYSRYGRKFVKNYDR